MRGKQQGSAGSRLYLPAPRIPGHYYREVTREPVALLGGGVAGHQPCLHLFHQAGRRGEAGGNPDGVDILKLGEVQVVRGLYWIVRGL